MPQRPCGFYFAPPFGLEKRRVAFRFKNSSAVVVGTFNIYIVQPAWLSEIGLLPNGIDGPLETDLNRPGFRFTPKGSHTLWNVRPDRLVLETTSRDDDCGAPLVSVLDALRWTPLQGIGANIALEGEAEVLKNLRCKLPECEPPPHGFELGQRTLHVAMTRGKQSFNVQLSFNPPSEKNEQERATLMLNVHTDIPRNEGQIKANQLGQDVCREWHNHRNEAIKLASQFLGVDVSL